MSSTVRTMTYGLNGHVQITLEKKERSKTTTLQNMNFVHLHPMTGGGSLDDKNVKQLISSLNTCHSTMKRLKGDILSETLGKGDLKQVQCNASLFASQCVNEARCVRASLIGEIRANPHKKELLALIDEITPLCAFTSTSEDYNLRQLVRHAPVELSELILKLNLLDTLEHVFKDSKNIDFRCQFEVTLADVRVKLQQGLSSRIYCFENGILHQKNETNNKSREDMHQTVVSAITALLNGTALDVKLPLL